jgi:hypothetical protein
MIHISIRTILEGNPVSAPRSPNSQEAPKSVYQGPLLKMVEATTDMYINAQTPNSPPHDHIHKPLRTQDDTDT